ncbi:hypothetical protein [Rhizobium straminoryzae]|nr:hypothetical protein [Rhizobium straminoryzae]
MQRGLHGGNAASQNLAQEAAKLFELVSRFKVSAAADRKPAKVA